MRGTIWAGHVAADVLPLVEWRHVMGSDVDAHFAGEDEFHTVHVAQVVSQVLARHGVVVPDSDPRLLAYLRRNGQQATSEAWWTIVVIDDARLGLVAPAGVVESQGESLAIVEQPGRGRYSERWLIPGVHYSETTVVGA